VYACLAAYLRAHSVMLPGSTNVRRDWPQL